MTGDPTLVQDLHLIGGNMTGDPLTPVQGPHLIEGNITGGLTLGLVPLNPTAAAVPAQLASILIK